MVALSIPTFWFGLVTIYVFSVWLGWLPSGNMYCESARKRLLDYTAPSDRCPACVLTLVDDRDLEPLHARLHAGRDQNQDYIRTARAKGLQPERAVTGPPCAAQRAAADDHHRRACNCRRCSAARW